jgi:acetyl-CoA carboxylase biotin carboxyl carrier protein
VELKEIRQIVEMMNRHNLSLFHLQREGFSLKLRKGTDLEDILPLLRSASPGVAAVPSHLVPGAPAPPQTIEPPEASTAESEANRWEEITSPMVGTLYRAAAPDAEPFVTLGSEVQEGSTVCIIEAMKVMNEIRAEFRGQILEVLAENGEPVEFGQPLFLIKKTG